MSFAPRAAGRLYESTSARYAAQNYIYHSSASPILMGSMPGPLTIPIGSSYDERTRSKYSSTPLGATRSYIPASLMNTQGWMTAPRCKARPSMHLALLEAAQLDRGIRATLDALI